MTGEEYDSMRRCIEDDFRHMHKMLNDIQDRLKRYDPIEVFGFYHPIKGLLFEANIQLLEERNKKIEEGADLIRTAGVEPGNRLAGFDWNKFREDLLNGDIEI